MFAISAPGLELILGSELSQLGVPDIEVVEGGVVFSGDLSLLYKANLWLRTASRVVARVAEFTPTAFTSSSGARNESSGMNI